MFDRRAVIHQHEQGTWTMKLPLTTDPRYHDAVLFDLDGVVTDTASIHSAAWASMFDDYLSGRPADQPEDHSHERRDDSINSLHRRTHAPRCLLARGQPSFGQPDLPVGQPAAA
jgi:hypothetical protein